ncbi:MAG: GntR family transcriptional regulator [Planctomycetota bacterium]|nr:GntR family transcriptional regulator [Planctomycetota bacterium]
MNSFRVDTSLDMPPSRQIVAAVLDAVATGRYPAGTKLLSVRALAAEALVNPNTAARAYRELEVLGVVTGRNGRGVFVTEDGRAIARERRERATLAAFARAAAVALRAGHDLDTLQDALTREENHHVEGRSADQAIQEKPGS